MAAEEKKELTQDICCTFDHQINVDQRVELIVDCHMHIESNNTAPLPLVWDKNALLKFLKPSKSALNFTGNFSFAAHLIPAARIATVAKIGREATQVVAETAFANCERAYPEKENRLFINMVMPMDMEYGHFDGYFGNKIYKLDSRKKPCWSFLGIIKSSAEKEIKYMIYNSRKPFGEKGRKQVDMPENETKLFENFQMQMERTKYAAIKQPFRFMPLYHFEPRRWNKSVNNQLINAKGVAGDVRPADNKNISPYAEQEGLKDPFTEIVGNGGMFVGIKMYTALGYMPDDPNLPVLQKLYQTCVDKDLPIMCHCTKAGMYTLDKPLYAELLEANYGQKKLNKMPAPEQLQYDPALPDGGLGKIMNIIYENEEIIEENAKQAVKWFNKHYISPRDAWGPVLKKYPKLKVCLAHFTGDSASEYDDPDGWNNWVDWIDANKAADPGDWFDKECTDSWIIQMCELVEKYDNVYIDLSYVLLKDKKNPFGWLLKKYPKLKERLLFGTDWHLVEIDIGYSKYMSQNREVLDSFGEGLWERFTCHNPLRFYSLDKIAEDFHAALKSETDGFVKKSKTSEQSGAAKRGKPKPKLSEEEKIWQEDLKWVAENKSSLDSLATKRKELLLNTREAKYAGQG